jgi:hypothetical protein
MDEIFKKLLESDVLSEETKAVLQEQFKTAVDAFLAEERTKLEQEVTTKLTEEFVKAQEQLTEAIDVKIDTFLAAEFDELIEEINRFRDLEVEAAEKLVEEKERLAVQLNEELEQLTEKLDSFLDVRLDEEFAELKEDIAEVQKLQFGRRIFEAMEAEFIKHRSSDTSKLEAELAAVKDDLIDAKRRITSMQRERVAESRTAKLDELLSPLSGTAKDQMKIILSNVATEKLDEAYKVYLGRVLKESTAAVVKTEAAKKDQLSEQVSRSAEATLITGNDVTDDADEVASQPAQLSRIRKLAGLA